MNQPLHDIVIAGGGLVGWLAASALARSHGGRGGSVRVVAVPGPDDSLDPFGPAIAALPGFGDALRPLGLMEPALMRAGRGSFSLGIAFAGWAGSAHIGFNPFGETGADLSGIGFQHLVTRARAAGAKLRLSDFSLAALAAQAERFAPPSSDVRSVLSSLAYGAHLDGGALTVLARDAALAAGAIAVPGSLQQVERREDGSVAALLLADGDRVAGDWFIDATGPRALLAGDWPFESWRHWLPCDRALSMPVTADGPPPPYALHSAQAAGWTRRLPLRDGALATLLFSSDHAGEDAIRAIVADARVAGFVQGRRVQAWQGNVVALGAAAGLLEPVQGSSLSLTLASIHRLLSLYPVQPGQGVEATAFNQQTAEAMDRARDFLIARYKTNGRLGEPMWDAARAMDVPEMLAHKMALYASRGRVPIYDGEMFQRPDWINLFDDQGLRPRRADVLTQALSDADIARHFERLRAVLVQAVGTMPPHARMLAQIHGGVA